MSKLSSCILVLLVCLQLSAAENSQLVQLPHVERKPVVDRVMVFPRIRNIYDLYRNYFQNFNEYQWLDRPLFYDRSIDTADTINRIIQNNKRQMEIVADYGVDGFSMLYHGSIHEDNFRNMIDVADLNHAKTGGKLLLSLIGNVLREGPQKAADIFEPILNRYLNAPSAARVGDKVLVASYSTDYVKPQEVAAFLKIMRERCGDRFLFVASIGQPKGIELNNWPRFITEYHNNAGKIPADELEAVRNHLRSYLDVCDGILMNSSNHIDTLDHHLDVDFYRNFIVPLYVGVLDKPAYKGKLMGLSASLGYINHLAGGTQLEDGTRNLRQSIDIALHSGADFVIMPEWNEYSENTCLEPTVNRGQSTQRIMRYMMQQLRHPGRYEPIATDDTTIPNLIISARGEIKLGQTYYLELLNVPDTTLHKTYTITCVIRDESDKVVYRQSDIAMDAARLTEHRIEIASELLADSRVLIPELHIEQAGRTIAVNEGLPFTRVNTTWNRNQMCIKRCLRDMPDDYALKVSPQWADDAKSLKLDVWAASKDDPIRYLEVLEDDTVVYAHDASGQLATDDDQVLIHLSYSSKDEIRPLALELDVEHGRVQYFEDRLRIRSARESHWSYTPPIRMDWKSNVNRRGAVIKIDHKDRAVLHVRSNKFDQTIRIADLIKQKQIVKNYDGNLTLVLEVADRALDIPMPNDRSELVFVRTFEPLNPGSVFSVRMITRSGRIMSSQPMVMPSNSDSQSVVLQVHSQQSGQLVPVQVQASRCPTLNYRFDPTTPGRLTTSAGLRWQGTLAGGWSYGGAFNQTGLSPQAINAAPQWVNEQGADCLLFDGKGQYCHFPLESIPAAGNFTIALQIKPLTQKKQYLIQSYNPYPGTVDLLLDKGTVTAIYHGQLKTGEQPYFDTQTLTAKVDVPVNQWTMIRLSYDFKHLALQVGDAPPVQMPYDRVAWWPLSDFTLGGWGADPSVYFHGMVKSLKITHAAEF